MHPIGILSFAALFITGAGDMVSVYVRGVVAQLNTPDAIRGRVNAVEVFAGSLNVNGVPRRTQAVGDAGAFSEQRRRVGTA